MLCKKCGMQELMGPANSQLACLGRQRKMESMLGFHGATNVKRCTVWTADAEFLPSIGEIGVYLSRRLVIGTCGWPCMPPFDQITAGQTVGIGTISVSWNHQLWMSQ